MRQQGKPQRHGINRVYLIIRYADDTYETRIYCTSGTTRRALDYYAYRALNMVPGAVEAEARFMDPITVS
jgi:uncharacterized membrane protein